MADGEGEDSLSGCTDEYFDWTCKVCAENRLIKEAIVYCKNCDECFCSSCLMHHDRYNKHHKVLGKTDKEHWGHSEVKHDTGIMCSEHGQTVSMYCGLHCDACCTVCAVLKHSDRCKPKMSYIPDVSKGIKNGAELSAAINDNDRLIRSFERIAQERTSMQAKINASREECARRIETFHSELAQHLNKSKEESVADMNTKHDEMCKKNAELIKKCRTLERELQDIKEQLTPTSLANESLLFVRMKHGQKCFLKYKDTRDNLAVLESHSLEFIPNDSLRMSVCSTHMLGEFVKVKQNPAKIDVGPAPPVPPEKPKLMDAGISLGQFRELRWSGTAFKWSCHGCKDQNDSDATLMEVDESIPSDMSIPTVPLDDRDISTLLTLNIFPNSYILCEEDETIEFAQRAKLFRFDKDTNQWKEKGIGEMKILKHKETGKYRFLLRREHVHTLVCNHRLTADLFLTPVATAYTSWCWLANNYSENGPRIEKLAVKFKTFDLAKSFKAKVNEIQILLEAAQRS